MGKAVIDRYSFVVFSLLLTPRERVATSLREVLRASDMSERFELISGLLDVESVYVGAPPPGGAHLKRAVLFSPKGSPMVTMFVSNMQDGWQTMVNCLSKNVQSNCLRVLIADREQPYPTASFEYIVNGVVQRSVFVQQDEDGWQFVQKGVPLPFEDTDAYRRRLISDRLNRSQIVDLFRRGGWDISSREFWETMEPAIYAFERVRTHTGIQGGEIRK